ncbi:methyl-coenzyme M reductase [Acinetobacter sp. WCHAc060025]|uniref:methyl-coenzyme M reductase n=1 Tax=Acinetobacter sp. WCHAc060025 TaxID=2518625 RepID=UPI001022EA78|nr:methyl-coenzyme M reductase [Acinetobacter sp. WCHAc060025]RZG74814.1 methyl-coenzyme M reductase [Acinetobacter sp. WCHAc060025]
MIIPRSQGRETIKPTLQQSTPMTGLQDLGNAIGGAIQARDEKLQEQEVTAKRLELYNNDLAEKEAKIKLDDIMTTEMSDQVTTLKNDLVNGMINAQQANDKLKEWSTARYKQSENDMPLHARQQLQQHWDSNVNQQVTSFLPLQYRADAQKGATIADQALTVATRQDREQGRQYLAQNLDGLNLSSSDKAERLNKYEITRDIMSIDGRVTSAVENSNVDDLNTLLGEIRAGNFKYLDGPTLQDKGKQVLSRISALNQQAQSIENKRVTLAGKELNDFKTQVLTGRELDSEYMNTVGNAVKGTEHEAEYQFYKDNSINFQKFSRLSTGEMLSKINSQKASMKNSTTSNAENESKVMNVYESIYKDKLETVKNNPNQAVREAGLKPNQLTGMELKADPQSFAAKAIENGVNQYALRDPNIKLKPISEENLSEAKQAFDAMGVNAKLNFIGDLIGQSKNIPNGDKIWGATLGQLGDGKLSYIYAGVARLNGYKSTKGEDVATAIISGTQALKNKQLVMPKEELLRSEFNKYVGGSISGVTANMTFDGFKSIYAHLSERDGYQHKDKDDINKSLAKTALSLATGGVYNQDVKYGNQKTWKVSKPYGMDDTPFEATVTSGLKYISSQTGIDVADLESLRLRRSDSRSNKGEIQYDLINERGNPLVVKGVQWRVNMKGRTK